MNERLLILTPDPTAITDPSLFAKPFVLTWRNTQDLSNDCFSCRVLQALVLPNILAVLGLGSVGGAPGFLVQTGPPGANSHQNDMHTLYIHGLLPGPLPYVRPSQFLGALPVGVSVVSYFRGGSPQDGVLNIPLVEWKPPDLGALGV